MLELVKVDIRYLEHYRQDLWGDVDYAKPGDAGFDFRAAIRESMTIPAIVGYNPEMLEKTGFDTPPDPVQAIPTGICIALPEGYQLEIRPRSGLALKNGITIVNSPGTIDTGYRGEIKIILANLGIKSFLIEPGDRIAQGVLMRAPKIQFNKVFALPESERGEGGFGSTGKD